MSYEFMKTSKTEVLQYMPQEANLLIENGGDVKRLPASLFSGGGGGKTYKLVLTDYTSSLSNGEVEIPYEEGEKILKNFLESDSFSIEAAMAIEGTGMVMRLQPSITQLMEEGPIVECYAMVNIGDGTPLEVGFMIDRDSKIALLFMGE